MQSRTAAGSTAEHVSGSFSPHPNDIVAANANASPFVETWPTGDPEPFARALARILVRQALNDETLVSDDNQR